MNPLRRKFLAPLCALVPLCLCGLSTADSPTFRNDAARTGVFDNRPLPAKPKVLWVYKQAEQFVATPVPNDRGSGDGVVFVSGLGPFNTAMFHALTLDPKAKDRELWSKTSPTIRMPTVSSPAVFGDMVIFGDGMHQTDGAILYAYSASKGVPLWQYEVPGKLVHMECPPAMHKGRVFVGGGDAGVIAVDSGRVTLDDKEQNLADIRATLETKYEAARKANPDVDETKLPRPKPKLLWQKGQGQWHVDAPIAITDDGKKVLVSSAYIDADKVGKRALLCLNADTGDVIWEAKLDLNPWGGATIANEMVLVGCSSIRFDVSSIAGAKGQVLAFDLATGQPRWTKNLDGGVLSPVVARGDQCFYAGTDGKIVCRDIATGTRRWTFDGDPKKPFFAAPAVSPDTAYAVDLYGVMTAIALADGRVIWSIDLPNDKMVQAPGVVFASPAIAGGHIYVVTNNLHNDGGDKPGAVICVGDESETRPRREVKIDVDPKSRSLTIPCEIAPRKLPTLKDIYPLEVVATYPTPQGQKAHETVVVFDPSVKLSDIHRKLESLGAKSGATAKNDGTPASGSTLKLSLIIPGPTGKPRIVPMEKAIVDIRTNKPLPKLRWHFTGSAMRQISPDRPEKVYGADLSGTLIAIYPVTEETLVQSNLSLQDSSVLKLEVNRNILPEEGTAVQLRIEVE